jgi:hypothetical protein
MPGTVLLLAASPVGRGRLVDAASVLPSSRPSPRCPVRHRDRQRCRTRRPVGAAGCTDPVAGRRDSAGSVDRVRHRATPTRPETAPSAPGAGSYDSGDRPVHRVSVGLGPGGVAVAGTGDDDVAARSARRRGDLAVAARPSARLGPHERGLRSHRTAACSAGGGCAVVHEGGRDDSAQRVASAGGAVASAGVGEAGGGGVCGRAVVCRASCCRRVSVCRVLRYRVLPYRVSGVGAGCCRTGCCGAGCWCGRPWGLRPQTPIGPEGASSSNAGRAGFCRPEWTERAAKAGGCGPAWRERAARSGGRWPEWKECGSGRGQ